MPAMLHVNNFIIQKIDMENVIPSLKHRREFVVCSIQRNLSKLSMLNRQFTSLVCVCF